MIYSLWHNADTIGSIIDLVIAFALSVSVGFFVYWLIYVVRGWFSK